MVSLRAALLLAASAASIVLVACSDEAPAIVPAPEAPPVKAERAEREKPLGMQVPEHEPVPFPNVIHYCELGQTKSCGIAMPTLDGEPRGPNMHCIDRGDGVLTWNRSDCATPLVVAFDDAPIAFTHAEGAFALGPYARTEWVGASTPWLGLDRDGSGCIEGEAELFRFDRLRSLDENRDGVLDARDPAFEALVLWSDADQDRRCRPSELRHLADAGIEALDLHDVVPARIPFGSHEGETAAVTLTGGRRGRLVDVYLAPL